MLRKQLHLHLQTVKPMNIPTGQHNNPTPGKISCIEKNWLVGQQEGKLNGSHSTKPQMGT